MKFLLVIEVCYTGLNPNLTHALFSIGMVQPKKLMPLTLILLELGIATSLQSGSQTKPACREVREALWHK